MSNGHAQAALLAKIGSEQAIEDFKAGKALVDNPFPERSERWWAWDTKMTRLICNRDHGPVCCQEHDMHLGGKVRYHWGLSSCTECETEVDKQRSLNEKASKK
ncbi:hypothetical protein BJD78_gp62 [Arthrobacter phage KellEzio]|uniref:Uncharacterized protein n=1 Tax=Arthrobacter phage KellEzio TaxID=1796995 RepID=A0A140G6E7_9CAUD|nr:hypothetical protein BJD78_gp62 [Arthrobacter phage KellEzio]AMM44232.1 hypothetical protein KELLEZIO_62 [Arthrobacter phage KellEzio]